VNRVEEKRSGRWKKVHNGKLACEECSQQKEGRSGISSEWIHNTWQKGRERGDSGNPNEKRRKNRDSRKSLCVKKKRSDTAAHSKKKPQVAVTG